MHAFFKDDDLNFLTLIALGAASYGAADAGEVLAAIDQVNAHKPASWVAAWTSTATRIQAGADESAAAGHTVSAAEAYLRASTYFSIASYQADAAEQPPSFAELWEQSRSCWDRFCELHEPGGEPVEIPYEDTTLPGWFFRSGAAGEPRRTLIFNNGSDGGPFAAWVQGVAAALERGWNALVFDGPGQNAAMVRQQLWFRADWEKVIAPVVDHLLTRDDVRADGIALLGVSQGGYWVPRAVAFEHRIAAAVADPGVLDVGTTMLDHLPHSMVKLLDAGDQAKFDRNMHMSERVSRQLRAMAALRFRPYGTDSAFEVFTRAQQMSLTDEVIAAIECPVLVTDPDHEQFWPGQPKELYEKLPGPKAIVPFTTDEGADGHCEPAANRLRAQRIFDWLDEQIPATP